MPSLLSLLSLIHLVGLTLAAGAATVKLALLVACRADVARLRSYLALDRIVTRHIIVGMVLLTGSGGGFLWLGYHLTPVLILKLVLVGAIWVLGPVIDNAIEPKLRRLATEETLASPSALFLRVRDQHLLLEAIATALFYVVMAVWVLR